MPLRQRLFIIFTAIFLFILAISIFLLLLNKKSAAPDAEQTTNTPAATTVPRGNVTNPQTGATPTVLPKNITVKPLTATETEANTVKKLAQVFVERYQTYSTDAAFQNIRDVETLVSPSYWKKLSAVIKPLPASTSTVKNYIAATTQVIVATVDSISKDTATVTIKTRRIGVEKGAESTTYPTITITLVKQNGTWLVDSQTVSK
jgi:hypothetical protein